MERFSERFMERFIERFIERFSERFSERYSNAYSGGVLEFERKDTLIIFIFGGYDPLSLFILSGKWLFITCVVYIRYSMFTSIFYIFIYISNNNFERKDIINHRLP